MPKVLIVGAGFFGATCARLLTDAGWSCQVVDRRPHIGGNAYSRFDEPSQSHEHVYGAHIFHTNSAKVWDFVQQFATFSPYRHKVVALHGDRMLSLPVNLMTLHQILGVRTPEEAIAQLARERSTAAPGKDLESWCIANVGEAVYRLLIEGYTAKQWGKPLRELPSSLIRRLPVRLNYNNDYFDDRYQGIPIDGYTSLFENMLSGVPIELEVDFLDQRDRWMAGFDQIIYSGPLDAYFGHDLGKLEYRSLRFERSHIATNDFQGNSVVNYTARDVSWTRIIEHRHFRAACDPLPETGSTLITREFPVTPDESAEPYYPMDFGSNVELAKRYRARAEALAPRVFFGGRLGDYRYYDMHQVIGSAMALCAKLLHPE